MVQVLGYVIYRETCENCDAILTFQKEDVKLREVYIASSRSYAKDKYIECPNCNTEVYVSMKLHTNH